jgi:DUF1009 family protein
VERSLALMCGAGVLPARMASEARRQGWRVVAFRFGEAPNLDVHADLVIPSRFTEVGPVLAALQREGISAALFSGKFWMRDLLRAETADGDAAAVRLEAEAQARSDPRLAGVVLATLNGLGVEVLDQRCFVGDWLSRAGCWSARTPTPAEWDDIDAGFRAARALADHAIGQTVVIKRGAITAVEAVEGTTETIRRGTALAGAAAVIVKSVARDHDYRFDLPAVGPETIEAVAAGRASVLAFEAGRVLLVESEATVQRADAAGIALVGASGDDRHRDDERQRWP